MSLKTTFPKALSALILPIMLVVILREYVAD